MRQIRENKKQHNISTVTAFGLTGRDYVRELVRTRDNYQCQNCGVYKKPSGRRLDVHHLNGLCGKRSMKADSINNMGGLITLCHRCHYHHHEFSMVITGRYRR